MNVTGVHWTIRGEWEKTRRGVKRASVENAPRAPPAFRDFLLHHHLRAGHGGNA